jgi:Protein of unknown function (DUF1559)
MNDFELDEKRPRRSKRSALVAIALALLVSAIIGLVHVAYKSAREARLQVYCANNLKQIGLALSNYNSAFGNYPYAAECNDRIPPEKRISWQLFNLRYLCCPHCWGLNDYGQIDFSRPWDEEPQRQFAVLPLDFLLCPSSSFQPEQGTYSSELAINRAKLTKNVPASYVGIAGVGKDAASFAAADPRAGLFGFNRTFTATDIKDGLSSTMAVAETSDLGSPWTSGGWATVRGLDPARQPYLGKGRQFGGSHTGGANVLCIDGSVRFIRDTVDPKVFEALATVAGGEKLPLGWND